MQQNQRIILYILILIAGASWTVMGIPPQKVSADVGSASAPQAGFIAPDFSLESAEGEQYTLSALKGHPVLVNLWATWCPPCRAEMPAIEKMYQEYRGRGFIVLAVNMTSQDDPLKVNPFVQEHELTFPILFDRTGAVAISYQLRSLPSSYFISPDGTISKVVIGGPMSEALLRSSIEGIMQ
jgi:cytochrome c biogenesis protein CcmG, thiol:disulfide interchange protein DsbE